MNHSIHSNEKHFIDRVGWLRAGVLGANDGILSTTSIVIGVAAATSNRDTIILAALSGLIAGAMSMAAGEYISVSSQSDTEKADIKREHKELQEMPEEELEELALIYKKKGLSEELAHQVAEELTEHDALEAHLRDELGINENTQAKPLQAAAASFASFTVGGALPLLVAIFGSLAAMIYLQYGFALLFLIFLGMLAAKTGGAPLGKSVLRIAFWGTAAMAAAAFVGHLFGTGIGG